METLNKLKIIGNVSIYSDENTYDTYKNIISPIKEKLISKEIEALEVDYIDNFQKEYKPFTNSKNWGSNLDIFEIELNKNLEATISSSSFDRYSTFSSRVFKFKISFNLPENLIGLFTNEIDKAFYLRCVNIYESEIESAEEKRIKEIGKELLNCLK